MNIACSLFYFLFLAKKSLSKKRKKISKEKLYFSSPFRLGFGIQRLGFSSLIQPIFVNSCLWYVIPSFLSLIYWKKMMKLVMHA